MAIGTSIGKFATPTASAARPAANRAPVRKSKYAGIAAASVRDPMPPVGVYRFEVVECRDNPSPKPGGNDTFRVTLRVVEKAEGGEGVKIGDKVVMLQMTSGSGAQSGLARVKSFFIAAAGFETEEDYDGFDPDGLFIAACVGESNEYSEKGLTVVGRHVDCRVTRGRDTKDGTDFYRDYAWFAVKDEEQPQPTGAAA